MASTSLAALSGRYRIGTLLGEGATATVSRAFDELLHRDVAIKLLKPAFAQDPAVLERFYAEARAAAGLVDPRVVGLYDILSEGSLHAIVMEYVDGPSLAGVLAREGRIEETRAVGWVRRIAQALAAAHARGILHRDIKPANVLLTSGGDVKVADFGLAKAFAATDPALTEAGRLVGSAHYFSPEQAQGLPLTPASDLYSLGIVLYQLVTGALPFSADSPLSIAVAHVTAPPPSEAELARAMSPGLVAIVSRLLRKDPHERFASAAELDAALAALDDAPAHDPAWDEATIVGTVPVVARPPRRSLLAPLGAAAGAFFGWTQRHSHRTIEPALDALGTRIARHVGAIPFETRAIAGAVLLLIVVVSALAARPRTVAQSHAPAAANVPATVAVPNLLGSSYGAARKMLHRANLPAQFAARIANVPANVVVEQYPAAGTRVAPKTRTLVVISAGPRPRILLTGAAPANGTAVVRPHPHSAQQGGEGD